MTRIVRDDKFPLRGPQHSAKEPSLSMILIEIGNGRCLGDTWEFPTSCWMQRVGRIGNLPCIGAGQRQGPEEIIGGKIRNATWEGPPQNILLFSFLAIFANAGNRCK